MIDITNLSEKELLKLRDKIDLQLELKQPKTETDLSVELFHNACIIAFKNKLGMELPPLYSIKKGQPKLYKAIVNTHKWLVNSLEFLFKSKPTKVEKVKYFNMFINMMLDYYSSKGWEFNYLMLLNNWAVFPSLLDKAFPDYIEAGVFKLLFKGE